MTSFPIIQPVIVLVGPTAIGKTGLSLSLAKTLDCEIIGMDSMQIYRYMDIGTAKATKQEREYIRHHLIDIVDPDEEYDAECFIRDALQAIADIHSRNKIPLITGGTGLYLRALTEGLFSGGRSYPEIRAGLRSRLQKEGSLALYRELWSCDRLSAERIHKNDTHRLLRALEIYYGSGIPWSLHIQKQAEEKKNRRFSNLLLLGLTCNRNHLYERINERCQQMIGEGLEDEVRDLLIRGFKPDLNPMKAIGYRHMIAYINGMWEKSEMERLLARDTRHYAKRQLTWFNNTGGIRWYDRENSAYLIDSTVSWLKDIM